ncbi:MAG: molybdopterin-dependent oxidoreductase [Pseudomonadota bacterium]
MSTKALNTVDCDLALSHWGAYEVDRSGAAPTLRAWRGDPDPSPIGLGMLDAYASPLRIQRPAVRAGWLEGRRRTGRGCEPFVEVSWDEALDLVAGELRQVIDRHGNEAVFAGSYGWSSAGRFHHAQGQVHRFLNMLGGYVRHNDSYSLGAGRVVMPHIVADMDSLVSMHHSWEVLARHTRLFVSFGGVPHGNSQVNPGGAMAHRARPGLRSLAAAGCRIVNISPVRADLQVEGVEAEWIPIRPNTDAAALLAIAHEIISCGNVDQAFVESHCVGFGRWRDYVMGVTDAQPKSPAWAEKITGVPARVLSDLARDLARTRSFVNPNWSLQRADHGEQPFWAGVGVAALLGQIGLPGGGFGVGYGPTNIAGGRHKRVPGPTFSQRRNAVEAFIPCARISDMLLAPGATFSYNGREHRYPDIELVYWVGGNPFHHHQDLHRLARAWAKPRAVIVHEQVWNTCARMADIVLPVTASVERDDIGSAAREPLLVAMRKVMPAPGEARDDYEIFSALSRRLGVERELTEGRSVADWLRHMYAEWAVKMGKLGYVAPAFDAFWRSGALEMPLPDEPVVMLEAFRRDPMAHPLKTPSGKIELFSERIASFGYEDCPGFAAWMEPSEWLGSPKAAAFPLHLLSNQPSTKLHSQLDFSSLSLSRKVAGREAILLSPDDARARGIVDGDLVRVFNARGACLAGAVVSPDVMPGVVRIATGAWWDPLEPGNPDSLDAHGNANTLTRDAGASRLSQGCAAQTCLVDVEKFKGEPPPMRAHTLPTIVPRAGQ